jgi:hypothetical protein
MNAEELDLPSYFANPSNFSGSFGLSCECLINADFWLAKDFESFAEGRKILMPGLKWPEEYVAEEPSLLEGLCGGGPAWFIMQCAATFEMHRGKITRVVSLNFNPGDGQWVTFAGLERS